MLTNLPYPIMAWISVLVGPNEMVPVDYCCFDEVSKLGTIFNRCSRFLNDNVQNNVPLCKLPNGALCDHYFLVLIARENMNEPLDRLHVIWILELYNFFVVLAVFSGFWSSNEVGIKLFLWCRFQWESLFWKFEPKIFKFSSSN